MRWTDFPVILGLVLAVSACASGDGMHAKLVDASSAYNRNLRWGDFDRAAEYLPEAARTAFLSHHEGLADELVIVDYEVRRLVLNKENGSAASRVVVSWHTARRLIVETTVVDQTWQWHDGAFVLVDEHRNSGTPLAVFAEREESPHPYLPGLEAYREAYGMGRENKHRGRRGPARRQRQAGSG
jgi:hypothetical protein